MELAGLNIVTTFTIHNGNMHALTYSMQRSALQYTHSWAPENRVDGTHCCDFCVAMFSTAAAATNAARKSKNHGARAACSEGVFRCENCALEYWNSDKLKQLRR